MWRFNTSSRGHNSLCGGIKYNSVYARIILQYGHIPLCPTVRGNNSVSEGINL